MPLPTARTAAVFLSTYPEECRLHRRKIGTSKSIKYSQYKLDTQFFFQGASIAEMHVDGWELSSIDPLVQWCPWPTEMTAVVLPSGVPPGGGCMQHNIPILARSDAGHTDVMSLHHCMHC